MSLSSVNLLWQKRLRGLLPAALHGTADNGQALLIKPDEFERRTYQILAADASGETRELSAITVETVYSWPGLGLLTYQALKTPDIQLLEGTFLVFSASVIVMNLLADILYRFLDPRVRAQ